MARTASQKLPEEMYHIEVRYGLHPNKLREKRNWIARKCGHDTSPQYLKTKLPAFHPL